MARQFGGGTDWMAPFALAARLKAETGEIVGRGYAALGQGIGAGLHAFGAERTRKEERADTIAREEARFKLNRDDRLEERDFSQQMQVFSAEREVATGKHALALQNAQLAESVVRQQQQLAQTDIDPSTGEMKPEHLVKLKEAIRSRDDAVNAVMMTKGALDGMKVPAKRATGVGMGACTGPT